jgi:hypothetical protein
MAISMAPSLLFTCPALPPVFVAFVLKIVFIRIGFKSFEIPPKIGFVPLKT